MIDQPYKRFKSNRAYVVRTISFDIDDLLYLDKLCREAKIARSAMIKQIIDDYRKHELEKKTTKPDKILAIDD